MGSYGLHEDLVSPGPGILLLSIPHHVCSGVACRVSSSGDYTGSVVTRALTIVQSLTGYSQSMVSYAHDVTGANDPFQLEALQMVLLSAALAISPQPERGTAEMSLITALVQHPGVRSKVEAGAFSSSLLAL